MDKLEAFKAENSANDAVVDDVAAKAYIENFSLETFGRADEVQRRNKVTRQTADTFQAAATFLALLNIWGSLEPEIISKIKFAKFHALRIAKAIKAGEDPNTSNPAVEPPPTPAVPQDENDINAELETLQRENDASVYQPPTVESTVDADLPGRTDDAVAGGIPPPHPQPLSSATPTGPNPAVPSTESEISPVNSRAGSIGGGYFPSSSAPVVNVNDVEPVDQSPTPNALPLSPSAADFYNTSHVPPAAPTPPILAPTSPEQPSAPSPHQINIQPPSASPAIQHPPAIAPVASPIVQAPAPPPVSRVAPVPPPIVQSNGHYNTDDESVLAAQKHAKWAISALNFEDVNTAVKELRIALHSLGAS